MRTVSNGARTLAMAHGLSVETLEAECTEELITKAAVQVLLVRQGVLAPQSVLAPPGTAEKKRRTAIKVRAPAKAPATMAPHQAAEDTAFKDPILLDGSTIAVTWPCGTDGEVGLTGRVTFRAEDSIRKAGKRKGRTKYRIVFDGREPSCGAKTSWNRLKRKNYKVLSSTRPQRGKCAALLLCMPHSQCGDRSIWAQEEHRRSTVRARRCACRWSEKEEETELRRVAKRGKWSEEETAALLRRRAAGEIFLSVGNGIGRTKKSCANRYFTLTDSRYARPTGRKAERHDRSIVWRHVTADALQRLGGRGTSAQIFEEVEKVPNLLGPRERELAFGHTYQRWQININYTLSRAPEFEKTDEKVHGKRQAVHVWAFHPGLYQPDEFWPEGKPKAFAKPESAKAVKRGLNYVKAFGNR